MELCYLLKFLLMLEVYWQLEVEDGFSFGFFFGKLNHEIEVWYLRRDVFYYLSNVIIRIRISNVIITIRI